MLDAKKLGRNVLLSRRDLGITQEDLASKVGVSRAYITNIEQGRAKNVGIDIIWGMADVLGVTVAYLLGTSDDPLGEGEERVLKEMNGEIFAIDVESKEQRQLLQEAIDALSALPPRDQRLALDILRVMRKAEEETNAPLAPRIIGSE